MTEFRTPSWPPVLADREFEQLRRVIYDNWGIRLTLAKKTMLSSRLIRRLKVLQMSTFAEYIDYVFSSEGRQNEWSHLINTVSTNKTDFFREPQHFEYLSRKLLPGLSSRMRQQGKRVLRVWSAGCSSGEEPYTLAIVLSEYERATPGFQFSITATDINSQVLELAAQGIYADETIAPVPGVLKHRYFMKGKGQRAGSHRLIPELRHKTMFRRLNLMTDSFGFKLKFDIIFCRNVIIYFDKSTQLQLFNKFHHNLVRGGYLFIGHSENLQGMEDKFRKIDSAIYQCIN